MPIQVLKFWTVALAAAVFFLGCSGPNVSLSPDEEPKSSHLLGRYVPVIKELETPGEVQGASIVKGYQMGWPGSGIAFRFEGNAALVSIEDSGQGIMDVSINGVESQLDLKPGKHLYPIVKSEARGVFDVKVTRRTEVFDTGLFTIDLPDFASFGGQDLPEPLPFSLPNKRVLFLGDSITAGFGVRGDTKDCQYNPSTNAPYKAYAGLTAEMLDAQAQFIAISGRGVVHNWDANPAPVMPAQIDFALPDHGELGTWDHNEFVPDVIVTTLGTNDWSVINPGQDKFRSGYRDMLKGLRERFPDAHILAANGPLLDGQKGASIRDGIDWAMGGLKDENMSTLDFTLFDGALKWSCNFHPGRNSMNKMANQLSAHISAVTGWTYEPLSLPKPHLIAPPDYMYSGGKAHFRSRLPEIDAQPVLNGGILLAGDSITEGWLSQDVDFGVAVSNHGIGWDTVTGLKSRLPQMLRHSPDKIFILIGTNDIGYNRTPEDMAQELSDIIDVFQREKPDVKIYIQSVMPREGPAMPSVNSINSAYKDLAAEQGVTYIDLGSEFAAADRTLKPDLTYDGLHLNAQGYQVWEKILKAYIEE